MSLEEIQQRMKKLKKTEVIDSSDTTLSMEEIFLKKADGNETKIKDFPNGLDWFNSQPLSFHHHLKGKVVILDFWTYCCMNCIHVIPDLKYLENKYKNNNSVVFIGVHSAKFENEKLSENIQNSILKHDIKHPVVNDFEMSMWKDLKIKCWPTFVLVNPNGKLIKKFVGEGNRNDLEIMIDATLKFHSKELSQKEVIEFQTISLSHYLKFPSNILFYNDLIFVSDSSNNRFILFLLKNQKNCCFKFKIF
jgi:thiol-disulfide isomerase/thioredoxin